MSWTTSFCSSSLHFCHLSDQLGKPSQLIRWTHSKPTGLPWLSVRQRTAKSVIATCRLLGTILLLEFFWTPPPRLEARMFLLTSPLKVNHLGSTGHFRKQNSKRANTHSVLRCGSGERGKRLEKFRNVTPKMRIGSSKSQVFFHQLHLRYHRF